LRLFFPRLDRALAAEINKHLRFQINAAHTDADIDYMLEIIKVVS